MEQTICCEKFPYQDNRGTSSQLISYFRRIGYTLSKLVSVDKTIICLSSCVCLPVSLARILEKNQKDVYCLYLSSPFSSSHKMKAIRGTESFNIVIPFFIQSCFVLLFMADTQMSQRRHMKDKGCYGSRFQMLFIARFSNADLLIAAHCTRVEWTIQMSQSSLKDLFFSWRKALFVQGTIYKSIVIFYSYEIMLFLSLTAELSCWLPFGSFTNNLCAVSHA